MKKSVVVLLIVIYAAAIVFVNFFGMEFLAFNEVVYTESVECINSDMIEHSTGEYKYAVVKYTPGVTYTIEHKVYPENATNKNVTYIYDENSIMSISPLGIVTFNEPTKRITDFTIIIRTMDGKDRETKIMLSLRKV